MKVKICGITNLEDALLIQEQGAEALGFIFATISPRQIKPENCKQITLELDPFIAKIGVVVNEEVKTAANITKYCGLTGLQLHGNEDEQYILNLKEHFSGSIIKAFRLKTLEECEILKTFSAELISAFLIDGPGGQLLEKNILERTMQLVSPGKLIIAGGLDENNIEEILQKYKPCAIDLCSSLESEKGKKDLGKVKSFFRKIKSF